MNILGDNDKMLFGKYNGRKLIDVPALYLIWLYDQEWFKKITFSHEVQVRNYIKDNLEVLKKQAKSK